MALFLDKVILVSLYSFAVRPKIETDCLDFVKPQFLRQKCLWTSQNWLIYKCNDKDVSKFPLLLVMIFLSGKRKDALSLVCFRYIRRAAQKTFFNPHSLEKNESSPIVLRYFLWTPSFGFFKERKSWIFSFPNLTGQLCIMSAGISAWKKMFWDKVWM